MSDRVSLILNREYRLLELLADGAHGQVFRAERLGGMTAPRAVGVRLLAADHPSLARLADRVPALSRLQHPHLLSVQAMGQVTGGLAEHSVFLAWDYGDVSLAGRLLQGPLSVPELRSLASHLVQALGALHDAGLVHGAVRPSNVLRVEDRWCLADAVPDITAGEVLARAAGEGDLAAVAPDILLGTVEPPSDLWALGVLLRRAAGQARVAAPLPSQLAALIDGVPDVPIGLPSPLDLLLQGLALEAPERRYTVAQAEAVLDGKPLPPAWPPSTIAPRSVARTRRGMAVKVGPCPSRVTALAWWGERIVCGGEDGAIVLFDTESPRPVRQVVALRDTIGTLVALGNGLVAGAWDGTLAWLDDRLDSVAQTTLGAAVLALSETGRLAVLASGEVLAVSPDGCRLVGTLGPGACAWFCDGRVFVATLDGHLTSARATDHGLGPVERHRRRHPGALVAGVSNGVTVGLDGSVDDGVAVRSMPTAIRTAVSMPGGLALGGQDGSLIIERPAGTVRAGGHHGPIRALAAHPHAALLLSGGQDRTILKWDLSLL